MKYAKYLLMLSLVVFTSCKFEIDYNADLPEDRLVIAAFTEDNSPVSFRIFHSAKPGYFRGEYYDEYKKSVIGKKLDYNDSKVKNARITLVNNKTSDTYSAVYDEGSGYTFDYIPKPDDDIKIMIHTDDYPDIETHLKYDLTEPNVSKFEYSFRLTEDGQQLVITVEIDDDGAENYYQLNPLKILYKDMYRAVNNLQPSIVYESHPNVYYEQNNNAIDDEDRNNEYAVISNKKFRGQKYMIKLAYDCDYLSYSKSDKLQGWYEVVKIDRNAYDYLYSLGNAINNWDFNVNPVSIKNAWNNAYGFIGVKKTKRLYLNEK